MNSSFLIGLTALTALGQGIDPNARPKPGYKVEIKQGTLVAGPTSTTKEAGDAVTIRPDGAIVATSRARSFIFRPTNRMQPSIRTSYAMVGGRVRYDCSVSNGAGSANSIGLFSLALGVPSEVTVPEPWRLLKGNDTFLLGFYRFAKDGDSSGRLSAGASVEGIRIFSDYGPGLIDATFHSDTPAAPAVAVGGLTVGDFLSGSSPWVQHKLIEMESADRHRLHGLAIGPVTLLAADTLESVRLEIEGGAQRPQLAALRGQIQARSIPADRTALSNWLLNLRTHQSSGIVADFVDAMLWRLRRLGGR